MQREPQPYDKTQTGFASRLSYAWSITCFNDAGKLWSQSWWPRRTNASVWLCLAHADRLRHVLCPGQ